MILVSKNDVSRFSKRTDLREAAHHQRSCRNFNRVCVLSSAAGPASVVDKRTGLDRSKNFAKAIAAKNRRHGRKA
jgi:hypothetical protein